MRLNLAFGVAMSALFAFAGGKPAKEPQSLNQGTDTVRIMSWNVRHCRGQDNKTNVKRSMAVLAAVCTLSALGALFVPGITGFIACAVLVYAAYSVSLPVLQNMVAAQADPAQKNLVMGFYNATKSLGSIAGSLTAGFIYSVNVKLPFACTAAIYALALVAALMYVRQMRKQ